MKTTSVDRGGNLSDYEYTRYLVLLQERFDVNTKNALFTNKEYVFRILFHPSMTEPGREVGLADLQNYAMLWGDDEQDKA